MELHNVISARYLSPQPGATSMLLRIDATIGGRREELDFTYQPDDIYGLSNDVSAWLLSHPDFPIEPHVAPASPLLPDLKPYQFRAMLKLSGKQDQLYAFIEALPEPQKTIAQSKLEYSLEFRRDNDLVSAAQQGMGLTKAELDTLWVQANAIE